MTVFLSNEQTGTRAASQRQRLAHSA